LLIFKSLITFIENNLQKSIKKLARNASFSYLCSRLVALQLCENKNLYPNRRIKMAKSDFRVIRETQVNTPESLLTIGNGETVEVSCKDFSPYSTVKSAVTRLNQRLGCIEFEVTTPDNGATIKITRNQ
jgi:hypothetical protein